jgi:hypothetical protein
MRPERRNRYKSMTYGFNPSYPTPSHSRRWCLPHRLPFLSPSGASGALPPRATEPLPTLLPPTLDDSPPLSPTVSPVSTASLSLHGGGRRSAARGCGGSAVRGHGGLVVAVQGRGGTVTQGAGGEIQWSPARSGPLLFLGGRSNPILLPGGGSDHIHFSGGGSVHSFFPPVVGGRIHGGIAPGWRI